MSGPSVFDKGSPYESPNWKPSWETEQERDEKKKARKSKKEKPEAKLQGREMSFPHIDPWPIDVDGGALLNELTQEIRGHIVMRPEAVLTTALWAMHTHVLDTAPTTPILAIVSPTKRCGKTRLQGVLSRLVHRALLGSSISPAAVFRTVEALRPTMLLDELDKLKDNEGLRLLLNAGVTRDSSYVIVCVGDSHTPRQFDTWCAKSVAMIGKAPDTVADRAIGILLERKERSEGVLRLRDRADALGILHQKILRWTRDNAEALEAARPKIPEALNDRQADHWEPLLAIADGCGPDWGDLARRAALSLSLGESDDIPGMGEQLLADIQQVFGDQERMPSEDLANSLSAMEGRPWSDWNHGRGLNKNGLAKLLKPFGIRSKDIRTGTAVVKGYERERFQSAFAKYVPCSGSCSGSVAAENGANATLFPAPALDCSGVAFQGGGEGARS